MADLPIACHPWLRPGNRRAFAGLLVASLIVALSVHALTSLLPRPTSAGEPFFTQRVPFGDDSGSTTALYVGDIDQDTEGLLDIVAIHPVDSSSSQISVYIASRSAHHLTFHEAQVTGSPVVSKVSSAWLADMNGDGWLDVVVGGSKYLKVLLNAKVAPFFACSTEHQCVDLAAEGWDIHDFAVGDVDGNGCNDVIALRRTDVQLALYLYTRPGPPDASSSCEPPDGTPMPLPKEPLPRTPTALALANLGAPPDGSGDDGLDIMILDSLGPIALLQNMSPEPFITHEITTAPGWSNQEVVGVAVGDLAGNDGAFDLVVAQADGAVRVISPTLSADGARVGLRLVGDAPGGRSSVAVGDVDNSGHLDILVGGKDQSLLYLSNDEGEFDEGRLPVPVGAWAEDAQAVALADMDADGFLDVVLGAEGQSAVYLNGGATSFGEPRRLLLAATGESEPRRPKDGVRDLATGDFDQDGFTDIIAANDTGLGHEVWFGRSGDSEDDEFVMTGVTLQGLIDYGANALSVAVAHLSRDLMPDAVIAQEDAVLVYLYDEDRRFHSPVTITLETGALSAMAVGDLNGDDLIDIAVGRTFKVGGRDFGDVQVFAGDDWARVRAADPVTLCQGSPVVALSLGDLDADGNTDVVVAGEKGLRVCLNPGPEGEFDPRSFGKLDEPSALALADVNGDSRLDVVVAGRIAESDEEGGASTQGVAAYINDEHGGFTTKIRVGAESGRPTDVSVADVNGDGQVDIIVATLRNNTVYLAEGTGYYRQGFPFGSSTSEERSIVAGDLDSDGDTDVVIATRSTTPLVYPNGVTTPGLLPDEPPTVANISVAPLVRKKNPVAAFKVSYSGYRELRADMSLDGGGYWTPAAIDVAPGGESLTWDVVRSGFYGSSDDVVLWLRAYPSLEPKPNSVAGPYQHPFKGTLSARLRVRGKRIKVVAGKEKTPVPRARVYVVGEDGTGHPIDLSNEDLMTDAQGILQGRVQYDDDAALAALARDDLVRSGQDDRPLPFESDRVHLFRSNFDLASATFESLGSTGQDPLVLEINVGSMPRVATLDLSVSLEWDATTDREFIAQLQFDLQRVAEILFDATNGHMTLGRTIVYQNREHWQDADVRVYASNRLRPSASEGGVVAHEVEDPDERLPDVDRPTYDRGYVRIGPSWSRIGDARGNMGDDWPRALAHELGHYALFLHDNYFHLDKGLLVPTSACTGSIMTDPYRWTELVGDRTPIGSELSAWEERCSDTWSQQIVGRSDWASAVVFYPFIDEKRRESRQGPSVVPLPITTILAPTTGDSTDDPPVPVPIYYLVDKETGGRHIAGPGARAYVIQPDRGQGDWIIDLGRPFLDQVHARGARTRDEICVFDVTGSTKMWGCKVVPDPGTKATGADVLLMDRQHWFPDLTVNEVSDHVTFTLRRAEPATEVTGMLVSRSVPSRAARFSCGRPDTDDWVCTTGSVTAVVSPTDGAAVMPLLGEGFIELQAIVETPENMTAVEERAIVDFAYGAAPVVIDRETGSGVSSISADGRFMLLSKSLVFGNDQFLTIQEIGTDLDLPGWTTSVGPAYRVVSSKTAPSLENTSVSFQYLEADVPDGDEQSLFVMYLDGDSATPLETKKFEDANLVSAKAYVDEGEGIKGYGTYALAWSVRLPLSAGWNLMAYPFRESRPVEEVLALVGDDDDLEDDDEITSVYGYYSRPVGQSQAVTTSLPAWRFYHKLVPEYARDLQSFEFPFGYWLYAAGDTELRLPPAPPLDTQSVKPRELVHPSGGTGTDAGEPDDTPIPRPPATFYGSLHRGDDGVVDKDVTITSSVVSGTSGSTLCGQTTTRHFPLDDESSPAYFAVHVLADGVGQAEGCGSAEDLVTFRLHPDEADAEGFHLEPEPCREGEFLDRELKAEIADGGVLWDDRQPGCVRLRFEPPTPTPTPAVTPVATPTLPTPEATIYLPIARKDGAESSATASPTVPSATPEMFLPATRQRDAP